VPHRAAKVARQALFRGLATAHQGRRNDSDRLQATSTAPDYRRRGIKLNLDKATPMRLFSLKYSEHEGTPLEWSIDGLTLGASNLIVGRNSSGKTRTLNVIDSLSAVLSRLRPISSTGTYEAVFKDGGETSVYKLKTHNNAVISESFDVNDVNLLSRGPGGVGEISAYQIKGVEKIAFQSPPDQLAAVARRDLIQHPFLEKLNEWANSVRHYFFGTSIGRENLAIISETGSQTFNERDQNMTVAAFRFGEKHFGEAFKDAVVQDLCSIGYDIEAVGLAKPLSLIVESTPEIVGLFVKEKSLPGITDHMSLSQGLFRALALFIHVNYVEFKKSAGCILIDDIGEGLDFERASLLIKTLRNKASKSNLQVILTTND
jgi:hypothetical protein